MKAQLPTLLACLALLLPACSQAPAPRSPSASPSPDAPMSCEDYNSSLHCPDECVSECVGGECTGPGACVTPTDLAPISEPPKTVPRATRATAEGKECEKHTINDCPQGCATACIGDGVADVCLPKPGTCYTPDE